MSTYLDTLLGQAGKASFTTTSASFTQPAVGGSVTVPVLDASWVPVGLGAFMATGGAYQVTAVPDSTHVTLKNLGGSSNAAPAATVASGQRFTASGVPGATGATGPSGSGAIAPVDIVAPGNVAALTGTQTIDGVSTANKRILLVNQTSTAQNGTYLASAAGAWVSDFAADADVVAAIGRTVFVKPGGASVSASGQNWQLTSGATLAGAKAYTQQKAVTLAPVRAIQTTKLLTQYGDPWVYDNAAGTWTEPYIVGGLAGVAWSVFDDIIPLAGDRLEVNCGASVIGTTIAGAGVFVITTLGSAGTKAVLTRVSELSASANFVGQIAYEVLEGSRNKSTRRQLLTQGAIVLGTTPLLFSTVAPASPFEIDLSLPPYNIRDYTLTGAFTALATNADASDALDLLCYTYRNGPKVRARLPAANGGYIPLAKPFHHYGQVTIVGSGDGISQLCSFNSGPACVAQVLTPNANINTDGLPGIGPTVDTYANATSLSTWRDGSGATDRQFFYNFSHQGLLFDDWAQFECRMLIRFEALGTYSPISHIVSCRGKRTVVDTSDVGVLSFDGCPFSLIVNDALATKTITAYMRLTDTTAGVYGATVHTGGGAGTVTGDGSVKPIEDAPNFTVRIETGGTAGVAGVKVSWAIDGLRFCQPVALGTATALVISNEANEYDQPFTAKVNFAGALVAGDTYKIPCSGVNQNVTLTSTTALAINTNYDVCLQYRSGKMYLYVSVAGGALASDAAAVTGVACTGVVRQRYWEHTMFGQPQNAGCFEASRDFNGFQGWLGGIRFKSSSVTAPGTTVTTLYDNGTPITGSRMCFVPNSVDVRKDAGGVLRKMYRYTIEGGGYGFMIPRSTKTGLQFGEGGFEKLTFNCANSNRGTGLLSASWRDHVFSDIGFVGGLRGWVSVGPDFGSTNHNIRWQVDKGFSLQFFQGELDLTGTHKCANTNTAQAHFQVSTASINQNGGSLFINTEGNRVSMLLSEMQNGQFSKVYIDAENQQQNQCGQALIRIAVSSGCAVEFTGNVFTIETYGTIVQVAGQGCEGDVLLRNFAISSAGVTLGGVVIGSYPQLAAIAAPTYTPRPFIISDGVVATFPASWTNTPICSTPDKLMRRGIAGVTSLTSGNQTVTWARGMVYKLALNTLAANTVYTLAPGTAQEGDLFEIFVESQATYTTTFANGGAAGAVSPYTAPATPAATKDRYRWRLDRLGNWVNL